MIKALGPQGHYLKGHTDEFDADPLSFLLEHHQQYGDFFRFRLGMKQVFVVSDVDEIQKILSANPAAFTDKVGSPRVQQAYSSSVARVEGAEHLDRRRLLAPAFTWNALAAIGDSVAVATRRRLEPWRDGDARVVLSDMQAIVLDCLVHALLGDEGLRRSADLARVLRVIESWLGSQAMEERLFLDADSELRAILLAVTGERIRAKNGASTDANTGASSHAEPSPDLLDCLTHGLDEKRIDQEILVDEIAMMLMTSIPTATGLAWLWTHLAAQPAALARACEEVESVVGVDAAATGHFEHLRYLDHVVAETLRLHPPVWTLAREALSDWQIGQFVIPAGAEVLLSPYLVHRCTQYWQEPERFAPERFEPGSPLHQPRPRLALMPFGAGSRKCIGERLTRLLMVLSTATVLQQYRPALPDGFKVNPFRARPMRPGDGHPAYSTLIFHSV